MVDLGGSLFQRCPRGGQTVIGDYRNETADGGNSEGGDVLNRKIVKEGVTESGPDEIGEPAVGAPGGVLGGSGGVVKGL